MSRSLTPFFFSNTGRIFVPSALETASSMSWMMMAVLILYSLTHAATTGGELLVAGQGVAERPFGERRKPRLGRAVRDHRDLVAIELRRQHLVDRAEAGAGDRDHLVACHQLLEQLYALGLLRLRVVEDDLELHPADAARGVDLPLGDLHRHLGRLTPFGALAGLCCGCRYVAVT